MDRERKYKLGAYEYFYKLSEFANCLQRNDYKGKRRILNSSRHFDNFEMFIQIEINRILNISKK